MIITLRNQSKFSNHELIESVAAVNRQIKEHFQPRWNIDGLVQIEDPRAPVEGPEAVMTVVNDSTKDYHWDPKGIPEGEVYVNTDSPVITWTVGLSHEVLEMLADPDLKETAKGPHPKDPSREVDYFLEICDPVQFQPYEIDGIRVSDFVLPSYYKKDTPPGENDHLDTPGLAPFGWLEHGIVGFHDPTVKENDGYVVYPQHPQGSPAADRMEQKGKAHRLIGYAQKHRLTSAQ